VPKKVEELVTLRGVGRKTANVIFSVAFGGQAIAVDTHVSRLSKRLGLSENTDPAKIERDLLLSVPENERSHFHHLLIAHGRQVCFSRKPNCARCTIRDCCGFTEGGGSGTDTTKKPSGTHKKQL
jgi:endonuclease-3